MTGKCDFKLPTAQTLKVIFNEAGKKQELEAATRLSKNDALQNGTMYMIDQQEKYNKKQSKVKDPVKEYVKNFGTTADMIRDDGKGKSML